MVDKLSKEIEKETKRREVVTKEKDHAMETLQAYQDIYNALNMSDPKQFMAEYTELQTEVVHLNKKMIERTKQLQGWEAKFKNQEDATKTYKVRIRS